jgi:hypothetical protein
MLALPLITISGPPSDPATKPGDDTKGSFGVLYPKKPLFIPAASHSQATNSNNNGQKKSVIDLVA